MRNKGCFLMVLMLGFGNLMFSQVSNDGLKAYYKFDGNANDLTINGYNGEVFGATLTSDRFGNENGAYDFDGVNDYIKLPITFDYPERTIAVWFNSRQIDTYNRIFDSDNPNLLYGRTTMYVHDDGGTKKVLLSKWIDGEFFEYNICENSWYFATVTISGNTIKYYINGLLVDLVTQDFLTAGDGDEFAYIGTSRSGLNRFFNGSIDDIRIFDRELSKNEILALYAEGKCDNLLEDRISVTDTLIIDVTITENNIPENIARIKVFPNPTKDIITIKSDDYLQLGEFNIHIVDNLGRIVFQSTINQVEYNVDINLFGSEGLYFVELYDNTMKKIDSRKIILE